MTSHLEHQGTGRTGPRVAGPGTVVGTALGPVELARQFTLLTICTCLKCQVLNMISLPLWQHMHPLATMLVLSLLLV